ncbi:MAG TPA: cytochrome c [Ignavibacteriales bacterium]|nr:cytochrome c [Ignavibacteriales bacterium]
MSTILSFHTVSEGRGNSVVAIQVVAIESEKYLPYIECTTSLINSERDRLMTKTQIWVAAFLGLFLILFGISRFSNNNSEPNSSAGLDNQMESVSPGAADKELSAVTLLKNNGCTSCHGSDLKGTNLAPPLQNVREHWSRDELISYLRNPSSFMDSERFSKFRQRYPSVMMPSFNNLDIKDLGKISDYLMKL